MGIKAKEFKIKPISHSNNVQLWFREKSLDFLLSAGTLIGLGAQKCFLSSFQSFN